MYRAEATFIKQMSKMTDLELATLEGNELHPYYDLICQEIDGRAAGKGRGNVMREQSMDDELGDVMWSIQQRLDEEEPCLESNQNKEFLSFY